MKTRYCVVTVLFLVAVSAMTVVQWVSAQEAPPARALVEFAPPRGFGAEAGTTTRTVGKESAFRGSPSLYAGKAGDTAVDLGLSFVNDDGVSEEVYCFVGGGEGSEGVVLNAFSAPTAVITEVSVFWPGPFGISYPYNTRIVIYDDPNDDFNFSDIVKILEFPVTPTHPAGFEDFSIPPTLVEGVFLVGFASQEVGCPRYIHVDESGSHNSFVFLSEEGPADLNDVYNNDFAVDYPYTFLVRAAGIPFFPGDVNSNNIFDVADLISFVQLMRTNGPLPIADASINPNADVVGDGDIDLFDLVLMLLRIQGVVSCFPAEGGCVIPAPYDRFVHKSGEAPVFAWGTPRTDESARPGLGTRVILPLEFVSGNVNAFYVEVPEGDGFTIEHVSSTLPDGWKATTLEADGTEYFLATGDQPLVPGEVTQVVVNVSGAGPATVVGAVTDLFSAMTQTLAPIKIEADLPNAFALLPSYPNPFNPSTTIIFSAPEAARVRLAVYNMLGREVAVLLNGVSEAGMHVVQFTADSIPSGSYRVRLETPAGNFSQALHLLK